MIRQAAAVVVALTLSTSPLYAQNPTKVTVSEVSANVHKTPSAGSPVIGKAPRGTELVVTREVGDWVKVSWPSSADGAGYVRATALARGNAAAPAAKPATATAAPAKPAATAKAAPATANAKAAPASAKAAPANAKAAASTAKAAPASSKAPATAAAEPTPVSSKAAIAPTATAATVSVSTEQVSRPSAPSPASSVYVAPTHNFGVGALGGSRGLGGSARAWRKGRLGMQLEVSRYNYDSVDMLSRASVTDIAPAVLFALNDRVTDSLWLRPYLGVAAHLAHSSRTDLILPDATESASTVGARVFVGGELSLASVPALAISMDVGYYRQPEPFIGFEPGGMGFSIAAHWYVK